MLNTPFSNEKILKNISQTNDITGLKTLIRGSSVLELFVHFETNLPISLCWDVKSGIFTGQQSITVFPKLVINGELYEALSPYNLVMPVDGFDGLEVAFMKALKESIRTIGRVWC